jgi:HEAT repeat protein
LQAQGSLRDILLRLENDTDASVRAAAASAAVELTSEMDRQRVQNSLFRGLDDGEVQVRVAAASALGRLEASGAVVVNRLMSTAIDHDEHQRVRVAALGSLAEIGAAGAVNALASLLVDTLEQANIRQAAATALGDIGGSSPAAVEALFAASRDRNRGVKSAAEVALSKMEISEAVPGVGEMVSDSSAEVRAQAARMLAAARTPDAIQPLIILLDDPEYLVRDAAVQGLSSFPVDEVLTPLLEATQDENFLTRMGAVSVLGSLDVPEASDAVLFALEDWHSAVRAEAAKVLGWFAEDNAIEALLGVMESDRERLVRAAATGALREHVIRLLAEDRYADAVYFAYRMRSILETNVQTDTRPDRIWLNSVLIGNAYPSLQVELDVPGIQHSESEIEVDASSIIVTVYNHSSEQVFVSLVLLPAEGSARSLENFRDSRTGGWIEPSLAYEQEIRISPPSRREYRREILKVFAATTEIYSGLLDADRESGRSFLWFREGGLANEIFRSLRSAEDEVSDLSTDACCWVTAQKVLRIPRNLARPYEQRPIR